MGNLSNPLSKGGTQSPPTPNFPQAAADQGAANQQSALQTNQLNNPNVTGPSGSQQWTTGPDGRPVLNQQLNSTQQGLYDTNMGTRGTLGQIGQTQAGQLGDRLGQPVDFSGAPQTPQDYEGVRNKVIDAQMGRANEDYAKQTDQANSDLIARGIRPGTKAYADNQQMIERSRNDARNQAEISGGNAAAQAYGVDAARRNAGISEILQQRQTPLNEMQQLQGMSQADNPFKTPGASQNTNVLPAPLMAGYGAQQDYYQNQANAGNAQNGNFMNGLFGLGSAAIGSGMFN